MKKLLSFAVIAVFVVSFAAGCGSKSTGGDTKTTTAPATTAPATTAPAASAAKTFTASEKDFDKNGYKATVSLTFEGDKLTKVEFDEFDKDGKKKSENADYNTKMKAASKVSAKEAIEKLASTYLSSQKVDTVAGATGTSTKFKTLVEEAAAQKK